MTILILYNNNNNNNNNKRTKRITKKLGAVCDGQQANVEKLVELVKENGEIIEGMKVCRILFCFVLFVLFFFLNIIYIVTIKLYILRIIHKFTIIY